MVLKIENTLQVLVVIAVVGIIFTSGMYTGEYRMAQAVATDKVNFYISTNTTTTISCTWRFKESK